MSSLGVQQGLRSSASFFFTYHSLWFQG